MDTNVFVYVITGHPEFGKAAKNILERVEKGEAAATSTLVLCEIAWVLEAMGKQGSIKPTLEKILSYETLEVVDFNTDDLLIGANNMVSENLAFNDGVNLAIMRRLGIAEIYSNDQKHLGRLEFVKLVFQ